MNTESILLPLETEEKKIPEDSSQRHQRRELCKTIANSAALHHPRKDPGKSDQETPITDCGP